MAIAQDYLRNAVLPGEKNLSQVFLAALGAVRIPLEINEKDDLEDSRQAQKILGFPDVKRVCVVLVDGLGSLQLQARRGHVPNLRTLNLESKITTVVPSTTAAGITALGTGVLPGKNAMAGYSLRCPLTGATFSLIKWEGAGYDAEKWQTHPTLFERLSADNLARTAIIQPREYIGSGLSLAALRVAPAISAQRLDQRFDAAVKLFHDGVKATYLYWGNLDKVGHKYGWESQQWIDELENFDREFGRFLRLVPKNTLVLLTADHGMVDAGEKIDIAEDDFLNQDISQVAGEERAFQIYTAKPDLVAERWREKLADLAWVFSKDELIASGILGTVSDFTASVIGDVVAFSKTNLGFVDSRVQSAGAIGLVGVHGSLTAQEMYIPLVFEVS